MKLRLFLLCLIVHQIVAEDAIDAAYAQQNFAKSINSFSLDLLKKIDYSTRNTLFSPLSLGMSLGMLLRGSQNKTCEDISKMLHFNECANKEPFHRRFKSILDDYKEMQTSDSNKRDVIIELANLLLSAEGYNLPQPYVDALKEYYLASVGKENFETNGEQVMEKINEFVKKRTHDLIPSVLKEPLPTNTIIVLINTLFFKGHWSFPFNPVSTYNETFYNADGTESSVAMMSKSRISLNHHYVEKYKASVIELPYKGNVSMFLSLPDEKNGLKGMVDPITYEEILTYAPLMKPTLIDLYLPKFEYDFDINLLDTFPKLGADIADALAPLDPAVRISTAIHKAKIKTHENGTEAAAVTLIGGTRYSLITGPTPKLIKADRPFLYVIKDKESGINLFVGTVNKLTQAESHYEPVNILEHLGKPN